MKRMLVFICGIVLVGLCACTLVGDALHTLDMGTDDYIRDYPSNSPFEESPADVVDNEPDDYSGSIKSVLWDDMLHDFWEYARVLGGPVSYVGRSSLIPDRVDGIPLNVTEHIVRESYAVGPYVELTYSALKEDKPDPPLECEIRFPHVYIHTNANEALSWEILEEINQILYDTAKAMMHSMARSGYSTYDIVYATEDIISICFYGLTDQTSKPNYPFSAITIDLHTGRILGIEEFLDIHTLTFEEISANYQFVHENSFLVGEHMDLVFKEVVEDFLNNLGNGNNFFISDESRNGVFLVLRYLRYYFFYGQ